MGFSWGSSPQKKSKPSTIGLPNKKPRTTVPKKSKQPKPPKKK